jgi:hypothetical protein
MTIVSLLKQAEQILTDNSTAVLTGVGVTGTVTTAFLTGRATVKAVRIIDQEADRRQAANEHSQIKMSPLDRREKLKLVWPQYIPAAGVGGLTIASIILANRLSSKQAAALAAAYGISEKAFQEYKEKVVEKLGQTKETAIRDEVAQDRIKQQPVNTRELVITGNGKVLCYDMLTGRYFESSVEEIKRAENAVNYEIVTSDSATLSKFYDEIGLSPTAYSDSVGWDIDNRCEVQFSTVMSVDDRPCIAVDYARWPKPDYGKIWS